ncbi:MAG: ABC transporter ATP-binding protein [Candidatus Omnitrophica bacterium]|nr:ABC transporter ATP-binding protein [Candidatus Omnitrophota bacterium]
MNNIIRAQGVVKAYGKKKVLNGVNLDIGPGSVIGLLGRNGAGKTTLLKSVLGLLQIDGGSLVTLGENAWQLSAGAKARIGYVPQGYRPYPWLLAGQLIEHTASFYPRWNSALVARLCTEWELDLAARVGTLSEGEAQKLAIVLALGHEPDLMVFDEPVASLDPASRRDFLKTILAIVAERTCTVFFSTHITSDLERVADTVAVLKAGVIDFCGGLDDLKDMVKRLRVRSRGALPQDMGGASILSRHIQGNEGVFTVRGFSPSLQPLLEKAVGGTVEVEDLNLEEIFLEMTR